MTAKELELATATAYRHLATAPIGVEIHNKMINPDVFSYIRVNFISCEYGQMKPLDIKGFKTEKQVLSEINDHITDHCKANRMQVERLIISNEYYTNLKGMYRKQLK